MPMSAPIKHTPRWIVFLIDLIICLFSLSIAYYVRFEFRIGESELEALKLAVPILLFIRAVTFLIFRTFAGLIRYTSAKDAERIFIVVTAGSLLLFVANLVYFKSFGTYIPNSILVIDFFATSIILIGSRLAVKAIYYSIINDSSEQENIIIYGVDQFGVLTKKTLDRDAGTNFKVI